MVINIISSQIDRSRITGPKKVLVNTLKGLDRLGIKYVFNQSLSQYHYNWIHDDQKAIIEAGFISNPVLVGPNTAVLPKDLPILRRKLPQGSIYLHPSLWAMNVWKTLGYYEAKLDFWPAGIDIDEFDNIDRVKSNKVLLYFKERDLNFLENAKHILEKLNIEYILIHYGFYDELDYKKALKECCFGIWIGRQESQGIGLQEALATNLPLIVIDAISFFDTVATDSKHYSAYSFPKELEKIRTTAAPYFDERCGKIINDMHQLEGAIIDMSSNLHRYKPREYIQEQLSLEKSAQMLVDFFNTMNITISSKKSYKKVSKVLFYCGLVFQAWAWKWLWKKIFLKWI